MELVVQVAVAVVLQEPNRILEEQVAVKVKEITFAYLKKKISKSGLNSLTEREAKALDTFSTIAEKHKKKETKAEKEVSEKILKLPCSEKTQNEKIEELFKDSAYKRMKALFDELENGKGIAKLQAEERIREIEKQREILSDTVVNLEWDAYATRDVFEENGAS